MSKKVKFLVGGATILISVAFLALAGIEESSTYYRTVSELKAMGDERPGLRLRVAGDVSPGSIVRREGVVEFRIHQGDDALLVRYTGREPLPDTLVDRAQAVVEGRYLTDGSFEASRVQAKCASKYEAEYPGPATRPEDDGGADDEKAR
jgi:cytochrome c-type biogenesis protein CcmE